MTEQSPEPVSLERARLLLGWLRAQRAVDSCLSELLAAGPAGERRVSRQIDRVTDLVGGGGRCLRGLPRVGASQWRRSEPRTSAELRSVSLNTLDTELRSISLDTV